MKFALFSVIVIVTVSCLVEAGEEKQETNIFNDIEKNPANDAHKVSKRENKPVSGDVEEEKSKVDEDKRPPTVIDFIKYIITPAGQYHGPMEELSRLWGNPYGK
ncbi:uncharacterized protein LOC141851068 [Brevipalpus obovatus]|uniref:uncharacterized protein LOC141851068 n=1 Tax=Brevipalpus obovatus TaxID=246614 RepID=UPI003D9DB5DC